MIDLPESENSSDTAIRIIRDSSVYMSYDSVIHALFHRKKLAELYFINTEEKREEIQNCIDYINKQIKDILLL